MVASADTDPGFEAQPLEQVSCSAEEPETGDAEGECGAEGAPVDDDGDDVDGNAVGGVDVDVDVDAGDDVVVVVADIACVVVDAEDAALVVTVVAVATVVVDAAVAVAAADDYSLSSEEHAPHGRYDQDSGQHQRWNFCFVVLVRTEWIAGPHRHIARTASN